MSQCQYRAKPGDPVSCKMLPEPGTEYCPRHGFLIQAQSEERARKAEAKSLSKAHGIDGKLPRNREFLLRGDYSFRGNGSCSGCAEPVEWWKTPNKRMAPFNPMPEIYSPAVSHFATCKEAGKFRRAS